MKIIIESDYDGVSQRAAKYVMADMNKKPGITLGLATGSTPLGLYKRLVQKYKEGKIDFSRVTTFNLDEYLGLGAEDEQSYRHYMDKNLFQHINISRERTHLPDGLADDPGDECRRYERLIKACGGIDLQVLGIGRDGHIGFNEPTSSLRSPTRKVALAPETIEDNSRFFESEDDVPRFALSMGLRTITDARRCLLIAAGEKKSEAVRECVEGPVSAMVPATVLQMHPDTTVIIDEAAASKLERLDYYRRLQDE